MLISANHPCSVKLVSHISTQPNKSMGSIRACHQNRPSDAWRVLGFGVFYSSPVLEGSGAARAAAPDGPDGPGTMSVQVCSGPDSTPRLWVGDVRG